MSAGETSSAGAGREGRPLRILFINQYYWPDVAATAQQLTDLAEHAAARGHEVEVTCTRGSYDDRTDSELPASEERRGVRIRRLRPWGSRGRGVVSRLLAYVGFDVACLVRLLLTGWRHDVIVTLSDPPLLGLFGGLMRLLSGGRVRHVVWSMDLYADCLFALGLVRRRGLAGSLLAWLTRTELRAANAVVVLGECMRERVEAHGVPAERVRTIGVWNRADQLDAAPDEPNELRREHGLADRFVVMYSGNAGRSHSFGAICRAMVVLDGGPERAHFLFVGGGKRLAQVEAFAKDQGLSNFTRLGYFPRERLNESLAMGDVHLVSLHEKMAGVVVPCKLYGIMGIGRPVLFVGPEESTVAIEITEASAGLSFSVDDADGLVTAIRRLAAEPDECRRLGANGRRFFLSRHEREVCCDRWLQLLHDVHETGSP